ncbi:MAG: DUF262 domain-containing protein [Lachnospiraceae bacterium]|nr:DUF262 domain-containing protein [Lachnospiraceae bacterium]
MRQDNYKITQYTINDILNYVENSQIAIPEIQRPFVWKGKEVRDLIDSLYEGYPIGYLIVWQNSKVRLKGFGKGGTKKILIDGQQRVTALMAAILGKPVLNAQYQSERIRIGFNPYAKEEEDSFAVMDEKLEEDPLWIPDISVLYRRGFSFRQFEREYKEKNPGVDTSILEKKLDRLRDIIKYQVGIIELSFLLDIDVVSEIFIRINMQGRPLNQEDFVMSKIAVNEQYHGDQIRNAIDYFCHLLREPSFCDTLLQNEPDFMASEYGKTLTWTKDGVEDLYVPTYTDILKVVMIASFGRSKVGELVQLLSGREKGSIAVSEKLSRQAFEKLGQGVLAFIQKEHFLGFVKAVKKAGFTDSRLIYSHSLLNYSYAVYLIMAKEGIGEGERAQLIARFLYMALLTGHYLRGVDSTIARDCQGMSQMGVRGYLESLERENMGEGFFAKELPEKFRTTTVRTAPFLAFLAMLQAKDAPSLYDRTQKTGDLYANRAESYPILAKSYLTKLGSKEREVNSQVANILYLSKVSRSIVGRKAPKDYEAALCDKVSQEDITETMKANAVPEDLFLVDSKDSALEFLEKRRMSMAKQLREFYLGL